jgi:tyrosine-protein kinase Etk/Wzc
MNIIMEQQTKVKPDFSYYSYVLYKWRKFLIINLLIVIIAATTYAFLVPLEFKATATIMIPPETQGGLGGLTSLLGGGKSSIAAMGSRVFGISNTTEDVVLGIINSRTALTNVINKFHLMEYYKIKDNNIDKALKAFSSDISCDPNEYGMIDFNIINEDPKLSADIANYLVTLVDSLNIKYNIERARNNRLFVEKRYIQNITELRKAEDSLHRFQQKYGIVAIPEQLEVTVKAAAEVESQLIKKEMESYFMKQLYGENSIQYQGVLGELTLLKNKVQELKSSKDLSSTSNIFYPFNQMPNMAIQYLRAFREVELQQTILEFVLPMYEQAKVEEQKSIPTIMVIDKAVPPELKYSPKRGVIILGSFFLTTFLLIPFVFMAEKAVTREQYENPLQIKEANLLNKIVKFYRMKF